MSDGIAETFIDPKDTSRAALRDGAFDSLVSEFGLDEVRIALAGLADSLSAQLDVQTEDAAWRRRVGHLYAKTTSRLRETKMLIKARNKEETRTVEAVEVKWSSFAERLATELYLIAPDVMQRMQGPNVDSDASSWIVARREQRARKANKGKSNE